MLLDLCSVESKVAAAQQPLKVDLTGGLGDIDIDLSELAAKAREERPQNNEAAEAAAESEEQGGTIAALPSPPRGFTSAPPPAWEDLDVDPADLVVIVGGAELGPYGSSRTRFEMEVDRRAVGRRRARAGLDHRIDQVGGRPKPGWYDTETGDLVDESELVERYHDAVVERTGIREFVDDGAIDPDHASPLLVRCSSTRTSPSWCRRRPSARVRSVRPGAHRCDSGAGQQRLAGDSQGGHRDPGAAEDEAVAYRRRSDPHRVRPDGVRHQRRT